MSNFIEDTKQLDEKIQIDVPDVKGDKLLTATFLPYYVDPKSNELMVVLKRSVLPASYAFTGRKMGLTCLSTKLPMDNPLTIEEAFNALEIPANLQDSIPFGSIMPDPINTPVATEMVLAHIDPPELLSETNGIIYQKKGEYEVGAVSFDTILGAIQENFIQDAVTRLILSELYIMAVEEAQKQEANPQDQYNSMSQEGIIGAGENFPQAAQDNLETETVKTSDIPDEVIEQNMQMDFGAIYSRK